MHRATPVDTSFRSYSAGGARSCVHQVDDGHFMQEMAGNFMKGETRGKIESPQNYGFTSVVMDADMGADGAISGCAEAFVTFCGGSRSLPVAAVMDDRRHRLMNLAKGDVAMFRTKQDSQQFHLTQDGGYWSAPTKKTVRMQLVDQQQQQQQGAAGAPGLRDGTGGGATGAGSATGGGGQQHGQQAIYKNGQKSHRFVDVTENATRVSGNEAHMMLSDGDSYVHCTNSKTYLGGNAGKHQFGLVQTDQGTSINVYARVGGKAAEGEPAFIVAAPAGAPGGGPAATSRLLPVAMLLLGLSLGVNYTLAVDAFGVTMTACRMIASR